MEQISAPAGEERRGEERRGEERRGQDRTGQSLADLPRGSYPEVAPGELCHALGHLPPGVESTVYS